MLCHYFSDFRYDFIFQAGAIKPEAQLHRMDQEFRRLAADMNRLWLSASGTSPDLLKPAAVEWEEGRELRGMLNAPAPYNETFGSLGLSCLHQLILFLSSYPTPSMTQSVKLFTCQHRLQSN